VSGVLEKYRWSCSTVITCKRSHCARHFEHCGNLHRRHLPTVTSVTVQESIVLYNFNSTAACRTRDRTKPTATCKMCFECQSLRHSRLCMSESRTRHCPRITPSPLVPSVVAVRNALGVRHSHFRNLVIAGFRPECVVSSLQCGARCCPLELSVWPNRKLIQLGHQSDTEHEMPAIRPLPCLHSWRHRRAKARAPGHDHVSRPWTGDARHSRDCDCVDEMPATKTVPACSNAHPTGCMPADCNCVEMPIKLLPSSGKQISW
jgi:hypothetical protein